MLIPILKAWEGGFWVEQIINTNNESPLRRNLPLGFLLQLVGDSKCIFEIVLLHQREVSK